jgi:hypothetical protein
MAREIAFGEAREVTSSEWAKWAQIERALQVREPRAARVVFIPRHLARTIGLGLPLEQLRVDTVALDKSVYVVTAEPTTLALDGNNVELAGDVAECDRSVAGHHRHPSTVSKVV